MQISNGYLVQGFHSPDENLERQQVGKKYWAVPTLFTQSYLATRLDL